MVALLVSGSVKEKGSRVNSFHSWISYKEAEKREPNMQVHFHALVVVRFSGFLFFFFEGIQL